MDTILGCRSLSDPDRGYVADLQEAAEGSWNRSILVDTREQVPVQRSRGMPPVSEQEEKAEGDVRERKPTAWRGPKHAIRVTGPPVELQQLTELSSPCDAGHRSLVRKLKTI